MKNSLSIYAEQPSDDVSDLDQDLATMQAVLELDDYEPDTFTDDEPTEWTEPCCEKCEAPMNAGMVTICR